MPAAGQLKKSITAPADLDRNSCLWFPDRVWVAVASSPLVAWLALLPCALVVIGAVGLQHVAPAFVLHDPALLLAALVALVRPHVGLVFVLRVAVPVRLRAALAPHAPRQRESVAHSIAPPVLGAPALPAPALPVAALPGPALPVAALSAPALTAAASNALVQHFR